MMTKHHFDRLDRLEELMGCIRNPLIRESDRDWILQSIGKELSELYSDEFHKSIEARKDRRRHCTLTLDEYRRCNKRRGRN